MNKTVRTSLHGAWPPGLERNAWRLPQRAQKGRDASYPYSSSTCFKSAAWGQTGVEDSLPFTPIQAPFPALWPVPLIEIEIEQQLYFYRLHLQCWTNEPGSVDEAKVSVQCLESWVWASILRVISTVSVYLSETQHPSYLELIACWN